MSDNLGLLGSGYHEYEPQEDVPFEVRGNLGRGNSGVVERVEGKGNGWANRIFARKSISGENDQYTKIQVLREVRIMRLLTHRHIAKAIFLYQINRSYNIIMQPVADCDLL